MQVDVRHEEIIVHPTAITVGNKFFGTGAVKGQVLINGKVYSFYHTITITFVPDPEAQRHYDEQQASIEEHRAVQENDLPF